MTKMTYYLRQLHPSEYRKLLNHYFPNSFINHEVLRKYTLFLYESAIEPDNGIYWDFEEWLEEKTEEFATPDVNKGYKF